MRGSVSTTFVAFDARIRIRTTSQNENGKTKVDPASTFACYDLLVSLHMLRPAVSSMQMLLRAEPVASVTCDPLAYCYSPWL